MPWMRRCRTVHRSALSYASRAPGWMRALGLKAMPLGLDLRGGLYLLYQVDINSAVTQLLGSYEQSFRRALAEATAAVHRHRKHQLGANARLPNGLRVTAAAPAADAAAAGGAAQAVDNTLNFTYQLRQRRPGASTWC